MDLPYHYRVFGLQLASEIFCPELMESPGVPDVCITYSIVPTALAVVQQAGVGYQAAAGQVLLSIEGIARFLIREGKAIMVEPAPHSDAASVRLFLLGAACSALLLQRGVLPLRGCAVQRQGECIAFAGQTGTGKSTLVAAFLRCQYTLVTDDICAITPGADGVPMVSPGYPYVKLWPDVLTYFGHNLHQPPRIRPGLEKRLWPVGAAFCPQPVPLNRLYILAPTNAPDIALRPLPAIEALVALQMHTAQHMLLDVLGQRAAHFRLCGSIVRHVPLSAVTRPSGPLHLEPLVARLESDRQHV